MTPVNFRQMIKTCPACGGKYHIRARRLLMDVSLIEPPDVLILSHQRSGTHFLQSALGSHPDVHCRGEFILRYRRLKQGRITTVDPWIYRNKVGCLNLGILMYSQVALFEETCEPLGKRRLIHLLREARNVATSVAQMEADRAQQGSGFRAHYELTEAMPEPAPVSAAMVDLLERKVRAKQQEYCAKLEGNPLVCSMWYEQITENKQTTLLSDDVSVALLGFLGLHYAPLTTKLKKSPSNSKPMLA